MPSYTPRASDLTATEWRQRAGDSRRSSQESWERSDTDGFLSQWASDLYAQLYEAKARIAEANGTATFPALFDQNGARLPAVLISQPAFGRPWVTESVWVIEDSNGRIQQWVPAFKTGSRSKLVKLGYREGTEVAPADAIVKGSGYGLSGRAWVSTIRLDGGYPGRDPRCPQRIDME